MMLLQANGKSDPAKTTQEMHNIASQIYIKGSGTDVDAMARLLRSRGLERAQATRNGNMQGLLDTLDKGQPVPFGVFHCEGTIVKLNQGGSTKHRYAKVGDQHYRSFDPVSGHWVMVVDYEGSRENPTHFIVSDPDLGGQIRCTRAQLTRMGVGEGNFFQITQ